MQQEEAQRELDAQTFVRMVGGGAAQLRANVQIVNDLNVFPIPDGDTGENMCLTINGGLHHIEQAETFLSCLQALLTGCRAKKLRMYMNWRMRCIVV